MTEDRLLTQIDTRLALVEQGSKAIEKQLESLTIEVRNMNAYQHSANAEAVATPAGRALMARLDRHHERIEDSRDALEAMSLRLDAHQSFIDGFGGTVRGLKIVVVALGVVTGVLTILSFLPPPPTP